MINKKIVLTSKCILNTLWQRYELYINRLELISEVNKLVIPFEKIKDVALIETELRGTYRGIIELDQFAVPSNSEWKNYPEYVVIDKDEKYIRAILYTPESTELFNQVIDEQLVQFVDDKNLL